MNFKVYVDWENHEIYTEDEFEVKRTEAIQKMMKDPEMLQGYISDCYWWETLTEMINETDIHLLEVMHDDYLNYCDGCCDQIHDIELYEFEI